MLPAHVRLGAQSFPADFASIPVNRWLGVELTGEGHVATGLFTHIILRSG